jgi:hypothetical protein
MIIDNTKIPVNHNALLFFALDSIEVCGLRACAQGDVRHRVKRAAVHIMDPL